MEFNRKHEEVLILTNRSSSDKICSFEVSFQKSLNLEQLSEIALLEITLPSSIKVNQFNTERKISLNVLWNMYYFQVQKKWDYSTEFLKTNQTDKIFDATKIYQDQIIIPKGNYTTSSFVEFFKKTHLQEIQNIFKLRFNEFDFEANKDLIKIELPTIRYENDYFINKSGKIKVINKGETEFELLANIFYNFDSELHKILGFDMNIFPCFQRSHFPNEEIESPESKAIFPVKQFGNFDNIFVYTDIVSETYVGNIKVNILRVFGKKESTDHQQTYAFYNPIFIPLRFQEINSIKVEICDSFGQIISYEKGEINLVLMIRPIENI